MRRLALITARGGSKRIPRKNIKPFCGKPIIAYSVEAALEAGVFEEVMVSTDDDEIARIAQQHGARVPFRRSVQNSDDFSTTVDVIKEVILAYRQLGQVFDTVCCIYPTAPFVTAARLGEGMRLLEEKAADTVLPVVAFSYPIQRCLRITSDGKAQMFWPENYLARSQDLEPAYHDSGQFYCLRVDALLDQMQIFSKNTVPMVLSELEVQDIDNEDDWKLAELKYALLRGGQ